MFDDLMGPAALQWLERERTRQQALERWPTTGAMACDLDSRTKQVPWLEMVDEALEWLLTTPNAKLMVSVPSQNGKSTRVAVHGVLRALVMHPDWRIIIATHSEDLARTHSEQIRNLLQTFGSNAVDAQTGTKLRDMLGIGIGSKVSATRWSLDDHSGGVIAVGVGSSLSGRPAEMVLLDDVYAGMREADSKTKQREIELWWESVAKQRIAPGGRLICLGTRWNESDIFAYLTKENRDEWRILNFPAVAEPGVLDSLNRLPGEYLQSARGEIDWLEIKKRTPARIWASMYLGNPVPVEGGLFEQRWFDSWRVPEVPADTVARVVAVDPADTGRGDAAGVIGASATRGKIYIHEDWSGQMTSAQWAKKAVQLAMRIKAHEIVIEGYTAPETYKRAVLEAWKLLAPAGTNIHVRVWRGKGDAVVRSNGLRNAMELGKCVVVGHMNDLESASIGWQAGQHCPDRVAAATIAFDRLHEMANRPSSVATPLSLPGARAKIRLGKRGRWNF